MFPRNAYPRNVPTTGTWTPMTGNRPTVMSGSDQRPAQYQKQPKMSTFQTMSNAGHPIGWRSVLTCATGGG